jgi:hypothetical protein
VGNWLQLHVCYRGGRGHNIWDAGTLPITVVSTHLRHSLHLQTHAPQTHAAQVTVLGPFAANF